MQSVVQSLISSMVPALQRHDPRLLLHLIAKVCNTGFGSDEFARKVVSIQNLQRLASFVSVQFTCTDLRVLVEGICGLTKRHPQVLYGFSVRQQAISYQLELQTIVKKLLSDTELLFH